MNTNFNVPLPTQFHDEFKEEMKKKLERKAKLLENALDTIQDIFNSKNYFIKDPSENEPIKLQLFISDGWAITMQDSERKSAFSQILSDPLFPKDEFDKKLAQFNWKLIDDESNTYYLIEIK